MKINKKTTKKQLNRKKPKTITLIFAILILLVATITVPIAIRQNKIKREKPTELFTWKVVGAYYENTEYQILCTVYSESGIDWVKTPDGNTINGLNKDLITFDYSILADKDYNFEIKEKGKDETTTKTVRKDLSEYSLINGVYANEPNLAGFNSNYTRYMIYKDGHMQPGQWIRDTMDYSEWYDYNNKEYANIYVENMGNESYYVWIPRYCYKIDESTLNTSNQRTDVKFIDTSNNYKDTNGNVTTWEELQAQGYKIPDSFAFNNNRVSGIWMSKYQLSESTGYRFNYTMNATTNSILVHDLKIDTSKVTKTVATYTYAIDGQIKNTVDVKNNPDASTDYNFTDLTDGDKVVNITALDENGEIIESKTQLFEVAKNVNAPNFEGFDKNTTFYVYYDDSGNEHSEIPISKDPPSNWYNYSLSEWANIVVRNNGLESYFTWIPRYEYMLDPNANLNDVTTQRAYVRFLKDTSTTTDAGYKIPEKFTFNGKELTGIWISKYQLSTESSKPRLNAEYSCGSNLIRVKAISGTAIDTATTNSTNVKYEYYLNGDLKHTGTDPNENYVYNDGIQAGTKYTVTLIARNNDTDEFLGAVTKYVTTNDANKPDLSGFSSSETYYVWWENGEEKSKPITEDPPSNWYDYSNQEWANIKTTANGTTSYFVWLPRYEYRILEDRDNLDKSNRRTNVTFIGTNVTNSNCTSGYKVPENFTFNGTELSGIWMSKYQLSGN